REVRDSFASSESPPLAPESEALLDSWLSARLTERNDDAIRLVRRRSDEVGSMSWLSNRNTRTQFVNRIGELVEAGDIEQGLWATRLAVSDVDPPLENYPDDPEGKWNCHQRVLQHEDRMGITTVRGSVCWLVQKLIVKSGGSHADELMDYVERLARDENAYVRMQAVVPLIELAVRRRCVDAQGQPLYTPALKARIRSLVMEMLRTNAGLPRILDWLAHAVRSLRDLSEPEASEVLDMLLPVVDGDGLGDAAWLLVFCAEYSEHMVGERPFDSTSFKARLANAIETGPTSLRSTLAFHMSQQFENDFEGGRRLLSYLPLFVSKGVDGSVFHHLFEIVERVLAVETNVEVERVLVSAVERVIERADHNEVLFSIYSLTPVFDILAAKDRWPTVFAAIRLVAAAKTRLRFDRTQLQKLLAAAPGPYAGDAQALMALLVEPAPATT
ncbi:MAG: hypothetical protein ACYC8T_37585, partial [Myxococcaceae bacterium]